MKLSRQKPAWHAEAAGILRDNFGKIHAAFLVATERAVWLGMFINFARHRGEEDGSIRHGQFGPWLEENVPELKRDTITVYMSLAKNVAKKSKFEITDFPQFAASMTLPPTVKKLVEGKTQSQLFLEFKQCEEDQFGDLKPKIGRLKGQGGASKLQRISAREMEAKLKAESTELRAEGFVRWATEIADDIGLGMISDALLERVAEASDYLARQSRKVITLRRGTARTEREED